MIGSVVPVLVFVIPLYVEMPFADQWMLVDLFEKVGAGEASLNDFTAWHDQHRPVFPRFIFTPLAFATNWTIKTEIFLNILLAGATLLAVTHLARLQDGDRAPGVVFAGNLACALVIFSLGQLWNWRWGFPFRSSWSIYASQLPCSSFYSRPCTRHRPRS